MFALNDICCNEKALQEFLLDIECLEELLPWTEKFNLFDVLKISRTEIRHSNMLGWLLDPNENHGFGDSFLKEIIQRLVEKDFDERYEVFKLLLLDMHSFSVYREWKNIDILLVSDKEKVLIAIENKVASHEHSNQLNRYREILETDYSEFNRIYVYLTPEGEEPSDIYNWDVLSYNDVVEIIEKIYNSKQLSADIMLLIKNYIEIIRRDIVEDQQLIEICNKIYNKHKKALDLIYANRIDEKAQIRNLIASELSCLDKEGSIIHSQDWGNLVFRTYTMDKLLPLLEEPNSSWGTHNIYSYWFNLYENRFYIVFELGGNNVSNSEMKIMNEIIARLKPNDKKKEKFKYKRVFRTKWYEIKDAENMTEEIHNAVQSALFEIKNMESMLLDIIG